MANHASFDFNKVKRTFFNVSLKDGRKLQVQMPKKKTFEKLTALQNMDEDNAEVEDAIDTFGALCAEILSHNLNNEIIEPSYMNDNYDMEEMSEFLKEYFVFVGGVAKNPN